MTQEFCYLTLIIMSYVHLVCASPIGYIYNASYSSTSIDTFIKYNQTCSECICNAFYSQMIPKYLSFNCYTSNKTCALFANYSATSTIQINLDSTFIFLQKPPSQVTYPLIGVTVAGYSNGTSGTSLDALNAPWGLAIYMNNTLYISECGNSRVMKIHEGSLNGTIVAGFGGSGDGNSQLGCPAELKLDNYSNLYVDDNSHCRVMLWRINASTGITAVGVDGCGNTNRTIGTSAGFALDSHGNLYISDMDYHRVMKWPPNSTVGIVIAGQTGVPGDTNKLLNTPYGLYLDEKNSYLYIADRGNNRIQRYNLNMTANGTTVAGGYGAGSNSSQLNGPHGVYVSKKTGDIYIADRANNRIQRWSQGASNAVTIAGITGMTGTNSTLLNSPVGVIMNMNETFLYVSDRGNNRVQRYQLT